MIDTRFKEHLYALALALCLLVTVDVLTNEISWVRSHSDMENYKLLFTDGLGAEGLKAPFAYRFLPAYFAKALSVVFHLDMLQAFAWLSRGALLLFLWLVFVLARVLKGSIRAATFAVVAVSFSFCNVKFLLFDGTRPDALGMLITLLAYLLMVKERFWALLLITIIGLQVREFTVIPFIAYLVHSFKKLAYSKSIVGLLLVLAAIVLPRSLIPVDANLQFVPFDTSGLYKLFNRVVLNWARHLNILFVLMAYMLPVLLIWAYQGFKSNTRIDRKSLIYAFGAIVLLFLGGTDLARFAAYLFVPMVLLLAMETSEVKPIVLVLVVMALFWFNRIGQPIPFEDVEAYRDFYGGVNDRLNAAQGWRWIQLGALILGFFALGRGQKKSRLEAGK